MDILPDKIRKIRLQYKPLYFQKKEEAKGEKINQLAQITKDFRLSSLREIEKNLETMREKLQRA